MAEDQKKEESVEKEPKKEATTPAINELEELRKKADEYLDGWKRTKADFINYKKDELKRLEEIAKFAGEALIIELLTVLDSFDLALAAFGESDSDKNREKGIYLIKSKLENLLKKYGLGKIVIKVGDRFDPAVHEGIATVEPAGAQEAGKVAEEVEAGYRLHGKLIRPAKVKIFKQ